jgi:hypothetical protein
MRTVLALAILLAAAAPARAGGNEVHVGSFNRALRSPSANALTEDSLVGSELGYARRIAVLPRLVLWATAGMTIGTAEGTLFQTLTTHLDSVGFALGGRLRYELHRHVALHARLDGGPASTSVSLRDAMGHSAEDTRWGAVGTGALGIDLLAYASPRFSIGVRLELGYASATAVRLDARPGDDAGDSELTLATMRASLGDLDLGGRFFAFTFVSQF